MPFNVEMEPTDNFNTLHVFRTISFQFYSTSERPLTSL